MKKFILIVIMLMTIVNMSTPEVSVTQFESENFERMVERQLESNLLIKMSAKGFENFLVHLGKRESNNNPESVNSYGYIGEFQFGKAALIDVGCSEITIEEFKKDPTIFPKEDQIKAITKLIKLNFKRFEKLADKYDGKIIAGVKVTKSGLIGAAHLAGAGGVKKFLNSNGKYNPSDGYGTKLSDYLQEFSGHDFNLNLV